MVNLKSEFNEEELKLQKEKITETVYSFLKKRITKFLDNKEVDTFHPLDLIFPKERRVRSIIGALETSMGTKIWEDLFKELAKNNGFEILDIEKFNKNSYVLPNDLENLLNEIKIQKINNNSLKHKELIKKIKKHIENNQDKYSELDKTNLDSGDTLDIWLLKDENEYLYQIKTVQPNTSIGTKLNETFLKWYTYRLLDNLERNVTCLCGLPFNPYKGDYWKIKGASFKPLILSEEVLLEDELWDSVSGVKETYKSVLKGFDNLKEENLSKKYNDLFYPKDDQGLF